MKRIIVISFMLLISKSIFAQVQVEGSPIKWYTIEQAMELRKKDPKPLLIDVYTEWCGWCKHMMKTTFSNPGIAGYINNNFYPVRFDAETHDTITYMDSIYVNKEGGTKGTHMLAKKLLNNQLSYPTIVYMDKAGLTYAVPGYLKENEIEPILVFFAENINLSMSFQTFRKNYLMSFPTVYQKELSEIPLAELPDTSSSTNWYTLNEAVAKNLKNPRPIFIYTYVDWCVPCKIMDKTTFKNKVIANYLNTKFYPVKMNALSQDSIQAFGYVFKGNGQGSPHQLIVAFMQNNFKFPGTFIMDGNQMVNKLQEYLPAVNLEVIAKYFGDGVYKTKAFQDYVNGFKGELRRE